MFVDLGQLGSQLNYGTYSVLGHKNDGGEWQRQVDEDTMKAT